jgi:hypothetical protein
MFRDLAAFAFVLLATSQTAFAVCPSTVGDSATIKVPAGLNVRIMYRTREAEPSYLEVCEGQDGKRLFEKTVDSNMWELALSVPARSEKTYLKTYSDRVAGATHRPWLGMRWVPTDFGILQNWFSETGTGYDPNTVIEVCLYSDIHQCPKHDGGT